MNAGGSCDSCWCLSFFGFLRPELSPWGYGNRCFLVPLCYLIVRRPNLEVATKRLLHHHGSLSAMFEHGSASLQLLPVVRIFLRFLGIICYNRWVLSEGHNNYFKVCCLMNSQPGRLFLTYLNLINYGSYYQKHVNQIILNHTTL